MNKFNRSLFVIGAGVFTSCLTAFLHHLSGLHIFTLMFWFVIPVGAIGLGFIAASGHYICAILLNHRPSKTLLLSMLAIAAVTQFLIYYLEYNALVLDDGKPLSGVLGFSEYLKISLTSQSYQAFIRNVSIGTSNQLGNWGYGIALLQFTGLMVGALVYYMVLISKPYCEKCSQYYKSKGIIDKLFKNSEAYDTFHKNLYEKPAFQKEFVSLLAAKQDPVETVTGMVQSTFTIFECTGCNQELLGQKVFINNGDWNEVSELAHRELVPEGTSIKKYFSKIT